MEIYPPKREKKFCFFFNYKTRLLKVGSLNVSFLFETWKTLIIMVGGEHLCVHVLDELLPFTLM